MKNNRFQKCMAAFAACAVMIAGASALPMPVHADNYITNSTFDSGTFDWGIYKESGGAGTLSTENGKLALHITNVGRVSHAVQMYYDILPLYQNGVYRLSYEISSTTDRTIEAMLQQNGGTYQSYTWKGLNLTSEPMTVDYTFTMKAETDIMAKLVFNCGVQTEELPEHTIYLDNVVLELVDDSEVDYAAFRPYEPDILTNQVGYHPDSRKTAVFRDVTDETEFSVVRADNNEVVYTGALTGETVNGLAGETDWQGDFSSVTEPGTYYIQCGALDDSYTFDISDTVYDTLTDDSVRMLYLQRCGTAVEDDVFGHVACHDTKAVLLEDPSVSLDVNGGWHDAGDYGRYVVAGAKAVADLLYAYEANPALFSDSLGIPESGNQVPDILDEARYELEWMLKMQAESGGVYHKVTCENFPGYVMPEQERDQLIVTPVSTTATADFCAVMAMAYEFYGEIDPDFAADCLAAAEKAWGFLEKNPNLIFHNPEEITTGDYGDTSDRDERYWAAAQMYRATEGETYRTALESMAVGTGFDWSTVGDYGNVALLTMQNADTSSNIYTRSRASLIAQADNFLRTVNTNPYQTAITRLNWGSNMTVANSGMILGLAYRLTGETKYLDGAEAQLHYLLGTNPLGECFVTGYGTVSPQNPHHRPSMAKKQAMKGMLVGGVNSSLEDSAAKAYLRDVAMSKRYVDHSESYSTNEITIYWNSPLTYLLALTEGEAAAAEIIEGDVNDDGVLTVADIVMTQKYLLNNGSLTNWKNGDLDRNNRINAFDLAQMRQKIL